MDNHSQYGVGLSDSMKMGSAMNGHYTPYQAMVAQAEGQPIMPESPISNEVKEFESVKIKQPSPTPIFTITGKLVFIALVLGFAGYVIYTKHKAKKALEAQQAQPEPSSEATQTQSNETPEPAIEKPAEAQPVEQNVQQVSTEAPNQ